MDSFASMNLRQTCIKEKDFWNASCTTTRTLEDRNMQKDYCQRLAICLDFQAMTGPLRGYNLGVNPPGPDGGAWSPNYAGPTCSRWLGPDPLGAESGHDVAMRDPEQLRARAIADRHWHSFI